MKRLLGAMTLMAAVGVAQAQAQQTPPPASQAQAPQGAPEAGGLTWTSPSGWETQGTRPMRVATYRIAPAKGDAEAAELAIFYFGAGQGGAVDANVKRWLGQFQKADGTPISEKDARSKKETLNGLGVTTLDVKGTYTGGGPMMGPSTPKPGYRLLGAIVEGPEGPLFFKLTGPERTVAAAEKNFRKLLESVKKK
ncbi:hypothetical protein [Archangium violaceum]|uniref:Lipoprotein n=1 Tax=Archangium violaceum Cb vi76 TaxID=1406225 RepID=A0A084SHI4_9BACT|nr:hypothetical protein [Archangium violaceum]KFA87919.1 hypothetical protein Q664_44880 [Archangium violaceum Cb vi76]